MTANPATLARLTVDADLPQVIRADAWFRLKTARGQAIDRTRTARVMHPPLWLSPDWMVATTAAPSDRRTLADHAETTCRNPLARVMGQIAKGGAE